MCAHVTTGPQGPRPGSVPTGPEGHDECADPATVLARLQSLRDTVAREADELAVGWRGAERRHSLGPGADNLAAYLALRRHDIRDLQAQLADLGLSSLGRSESHVLATLDAVLAGLVRMTGAAAAVGGVEAAAADARRQLDRHTTALFGFALGRRHTRIMVTLDGATDDDQMRALVANGMDCARINCGHDDPDTWRRLAESVRAAATATGRSCTVLCDLSGPRLRTGPVVAAPAVVRAKVRRDERGVVAEPGTVVLDAGGAPGSSSTRGADGARRPARLAVARGWLDQLEPEGSVHLVDGGGRSRQLDVVRRLGPDTVACSVSAGCYIEEGTLLRYEPPGRDRARGPVPPGRTTLAGPVDPRPASVRVRPGDPLVLTGDGGPGRPASGDSPARIACATPSVVADLEVGHRVLVDDGRVEAVVTAVDGLDAHLEVTAAAPGGSVVKPEKGLNFPDTRLRLPPLTDDDLAALDAVVPHADAVGYSFVRQADDLEALGDELDRRGGAHLAVLAKIETADAVHHLPEILARGPARRPFGVMIARGDLAIEIGYERLAEVQAEILWLGEAAHVPVVWATQVLEGMVKGGVPSRAEITDAAAADQAECVMLNKGAYQVEAVALLHDLLRRVHPHHAKKTALLPPLDLA